MSDNPLGKKTVYPQIYDASLLFAVARDDNRRGLGIKSLPLPFYGFDHWRAYELSWLSPEGKPVAAIADILVPCDSPWLIESKSMKLYFNSMNQHKFKSPDDARSCIKTDLSRVAGATVELSLQGASSTAAHTADWENVQLLDDLEVTTSGYYPDPTLLQTEPQQVSESVASHLFRSNCPITAQPDWGSILIQYQGHRINHQSLLAYIISYRQHEGFHEHCVEQIFQDILRICAPQALTVSINFLRRGGLEINPLRSTAPVSAAPLPRLIRQ
jgi:7-cyano-7-deazaguanine reductase